MPRLVLVAGDRGLPFRVRHDEAVSPRVRADPFPDLRRAPVAVVPRLGSAVRSQVERRSQLMLAMTGPGALLERDRVAVDADPVGEGVLLRGVASIRRRDDEAGTGGTRRGRH